MVRLLRGRGSLLLTLGTDTGDDGVDTRTLLQEGWRVVAAHSAHESGVRLDHGVAPRLHCDEGGFTRALVQVRQGDNICLLYTSPSPRD